MSTSLRTRFATIFAVLIIALTLILTMNVGQRASQEVQDLKGIEVFIISTTDNTVLLGPGETIGQSLVLKSLGRARQGQNHWEVEVWPDGKEYLTGYVEATGYMEYLGMNWVVLARQPSSVAYDSIRNLQLYILVVGGALAAIFALAGWFMGGLVANPLEEIARAADRLKVGEKPLMPQHKGIREIEMLETSIRQMILSVTQTENTLGVMEIIAQHDPLTGLSNRLALNEYLAKAEEAASAMGRSITFLYLDLDGFKKVNDELGHHAGDKLLREVAQRLKEIVRESEMVARLGSDEFVMVLQTPGENPKQIGEAVAYRVIDAMNIPIQLDGQEARVGCSIGGAVWPLDGHETLKVLQMADKALYESKSAGKNRVTFIS